MKKYIIVTLFGLSLIFANNKDKATYPIEAKGSSYYAKFYYKNNLLYDNNVDMINLKNIVIKSNTINEKVDQISDSLYFTSIAMSTGFLLFATNVNSIFDKEPQNFLGAGGYLVSFFSYMLSESYNTQLLAEVVDEYNKERMLVTEDNNGYLIRCASKTYISNVLLKNDLFRNVETISGLTLLYNLSDKPALISGLSFFGAANNQSSRDARNFTVLLILNGLLANWSMSRESVFLVNIGAWLSMDWLFPLSSN